MITRHQVSVVADGQHVPGWTNYQISVDMLQPADAFRMEVRFTPEVWELLSLDQLVTVYVDAVPIVTGYIDQRRKTGGTDGRTIQIAGRDKTGRLVDESVPLFKYGGLGLRELAEKICGITDDADPLFERVTLVNTRNRSLLRDVRQPQAKVVREPLLNVLDGAFRPFARAVGYELPELRGGPRVVTRTIERPLQVDPGIFEGRAAPKHPQPGATRWSVLEEFLREARLIAWASGDGNELFVGMPAYEQESQYWLFEGAAPGSEGDESNCRIEVVESSADRYSMITCLGAALGGAADYGPNVARHRASVYDNPSNPADGTGRTFRRRKHLVIADDSVRSRRDTLERAEREQLERDVTELELEVTAPGHGQAYQVDAPTLFVIDTMARVEDAATGTRGEFLVTSVEYTGSAGGPTETVLRLVPRGTLLAL